MEKLVLIDGHSILNRAFYGVPDLTNSEGLHTNAVVGFLNILFKILEEEKPDYLVVAFDVHAKTFRHEMYEAYKGTRKPMPEELRSQVGLMQEVLTAMGITIMMQAGLEADDILGTLAKRAQKQGMQVALVSGDRDLLQIATKQIKIRIPKTKQGRTEIEDYYEDDVIAKYQVTPTQFIDLKALMGDTADNIPGVPKVGEKTATDLIVRYGSVENLYKHVEELTKKAIKESLINNRELANLSKVLATINVDSPITFAFEDARVKDFYTAEAFQMFKRLEFKNLLSRFENKPVIENTDTEKFHILTDLSEIQNLFEQLRNEILTHRANWSEDAERYKLAVEVFEDSDSEDAFLGISLAYSENAVYFIEAQGFVTKGYLLQELQACLKHENVILLSYDIKNKFRYFEIDGLEDRCFDLYLAAYLLDPLKNEYDVEDLANGLLGKMIPGKKQLFNKTTMLQAKEKDAELFVEFACWQSLVAYQATPILVERLKETGMYSLMIQLEMPVSRVLYEMEKEGILIKPDTLKEYGENLGSHLEQLEQKIYEQAGETFNINSPKQLGEILFEKMKLPGGKKTKTGYSTAADVLEKLAVDYPFIRDILDYRGYAKLKSTYADGLAQFVGADNRIHTTFQQTVTATGRLSSTDPNLQNIPMRTELGRQIRKVFIPKDGYVFMDADYSQIELRVLAHMADDKNLIEAYQSDQDIHRITASKVFGIPFEEVTDLQRRNAKAVNFGIVYGISSFGLSQDLSISKKEAADYIDQYFQTYPGIKAFLDETVKKAKSTGYVTTLYGRRRPIPELKDSNFMRRAFGERVAMNSPIQGTAADIIKFAMLRVWRRLKAEQLESKLILQIHDELLIETKESEVEQVRKIMEEEMHGAVKLAVALEIDLHTGCNWYEAK